MSNSKRRLELGLYIILVGDRLREKGHMGKTNDFLER